MDPLLGHLAGGVEVGFFQGRLDHAVEHGGERTQVDDRGDEDFPGTGGELARHLLDRFGMSVEVRTVRDPELRKKLTPDYPVGCKRLIINNTFYDAVQRENVTLETTAIDSITAVSRSNCSFSRTMLTIRKKTSTQFPRRSQ